MQSYFRWFLPFFDSSIPVSGGGWPQQGAAPPWKSEKAKKIRTEKRDKEKKEREIERNMRLN